LGGEVVVKTDWDAVFYSLLRSPDGSEIQITSDGQLAVANGQTFPVIRGIPRFFGSTGGGQMQVQETFAYKWNRTPDFGISGSTATIMTEWMMPVLGWRNEADYARYLQSRKVILDAGCGNGRETIRLARLNPDALVVGIDISDSVDQASQNATGIPNIRFVQADLCMPPFKTGAFDYIHSFGVLHHTPNTKAAFQALVPLLAPSGEYAFYIYVKKAPLREYSDDFIRQAIQLMKPAEAWEEMEKLTLFGKAISDLKTEIEIPEIKTLGISGGKHDIQRLLYYTVVKCYWRDGWSLEENTHVNFDWFYPQYAWRHTAEEVRGWIDEAGLQESGFVSIPAGMTFRAKWSPTADS
jgi:arsenite methyltransferase